MYGQLLIGVKGTMYQFCAKENITNRIEKVLLFVFLFDKIDENQMLCCSVIIEVISLEFEIEYKVSRFTFNISACPQN